MQSQFYYQVSKHIAGFISNENYENYSNELEYLENKPKWMKDYLNLLSFIVFTDNSSVNERKCLYSSHITILLVVLGYINYLT